MAFEGMFGTTGTVDRGVLGEFVEASETPEAGPLLGV